MRRRLSDDPRRRLFTRRFEVSALRPRLRKLATLCFPRSKPSARSGHRAPKSPRSGPAPRTPCALGPAPHALGRLFFVGKHHSRPTTTMSSSPRYGRAHQTICPFGPALPSLGAPAPRSENTRRTDNALGPAQKEIFRKESLQIPPSWGFSHRGPINNGPPESNFAFGLATVAILSRPYRRQQLLYGTLWAHWRLRNYMG